MSVISYALNAGSGRQADTLISYTELLLVSMETAGKKVVHTRLPSVGFRS